MHLCIEAFFLEIMMKDQFVEMGYCAKPHGIKGQFQFHLHNTEDSSLVEGLRLKLVPTNDRSTLRAGGEIFTLSKIQFGNKIIATLKEVDNRNQVEAMIPFTIFINREDFKELDEDEIYLSDLVGLLVKDEQGNPVGEVLKFYDNGAQTVLVVSKKLGGTLELPFIDVFFPEVNLEEKFIVINDPGVLE